MTTNIFPENNEAVRAVADEVESLIRKRAEEGRELILGLATGATPVLLYRELIRRHREEGLSFGNVVSFNLDEYEGLESGDAQSYRLFMEENLFRHVDMRPEAIHVPSGIYEYGEAEKVCAEYERKIREAGGLDWQLLGIGRTGHMGFNEPGAERDTRTRRVELSELTRRDAANDFGGLANVPTHALTMGVATILESERIVLMAWGKKKSEILQKTLHGTMSADIPATFLRKHDDVRLVLDSDAADGVELPGT